MEKNPEKEYTHPHTHTQVYTYIPKAESLCYTSEINKLKQ